MIDYVREELKKEFGSIADKFDFYSFPVINKLTTRNPCRAGVYEMKFRKEKKLKIYSARIG
jgi:hypothetical protein